MKKNVLSLFIVVLAFCYSFSASAQSCSCTSFTSLQSGSYYSNNDFNCHMYVKAYFYSAQYGTWIPPANFNFSPYSSSTVANDPGFVEVFDPALATVVVYPCDHSAIVNSSTCLVSKNNFGGDIYRHGLSGIGCGNTGLRFFRFGAGNSAYPKGVNPACLPTTGPVCNVPCSLAGTYNGGLTINTVNYTTTYYNTATVTCSNAASFTWTKTGGNAVYFGCNSSNCATAYFYLNVGGSITFNIKAFDACGNQIGSKNATFYRSSGYRVGDQNPVDDHQTKSELNIATDDRGADITMQSDVWVFPNPARESINVKLAKSINGTLVLHNITGQETYRQTVSDQIADYQVQLSDLSQGFYTIALKDASGATLWIDKLVIER